MIKTLVLPESVHHFHCKHEVKSFLKLKFLCPDHLGYFFIVLSEI